jgi:hypothetical protein
MLGMVVLLGIAGLAVDKAHMYRARINLQKALDVGVVAGLGFRIDRGPYTGSSATDEQAYALDIVNYASRVAVANTELLGYPGIDIVVNSSDIGPNTSKGFLGLQHYQAQLGNGSRETFYDQENELLSLTIRYPVKLWIIDKFSIFGVNSFQTLEVNAQGQLSEAYVSMLLDFSGSMQCDATTDCTTNADMLPIGSDNSKAGKLRAAAIDFVKNFKSRRDRIQLVPYNIAAKVDKRFGQEFILQDWVTAINNRTNDPSNPFREISNTNPSDALYRAWQDARLTQVNGQFIYQTKRKSIVYFSDGAPTAGRFQFRTPQNTSPVTQQNGTTLDDTISNTAHYYHYKVEWKHNGSIFNSPSGLIAVGNHYESASAPSVANLPIGYTDSFPRGYSWTSTNPVDQYNIMPSCSNPRVLNNILDSSGNITDDRFDYALGDCLQNYSFNLISTTGTSYGAQTPLDNSTGDDRWLRQYYNVTISMADEWRANRTTVYAIGLGMPADLNYPDLDNSSTNDFYQDVVNDNLRKDYFLTRLALDPYILFGAFGPANYDESLLTDNNLQSWSAMGSSDSYEEGEYLPTDNPEELSKLFNRVARRILLRLIR